MVWFIPRLQGRRSEHRRPQAAPRPSLQHLEERCLLDGSFGPWGTPVNLGPAVNSAANDNRPAISKDGLSLYFSSDRPGGSGGLDLWVSQRASAEGPWGTPVNLGGALNSSGEESAPSFSRDGHWLFYHSARPGGLGGTDVWASYRTNVHDDGGWQAPVNLGPGVNSAYDDAGPIPFEDEETGVTTLYFNRNRPGGLGDYDIYASTLNADGSFGPAVLVPELSSPSRDTRIALRHDGREAIIATNRPGGQGGIDLWSSTRETTSDPWGTPVNLGPVVNTAFTDGAAALSSDSTTLYFYSNRPGGAGGDDLYMTTRTKAHGDDADADVALLAQPATHSVRQGSTVLVSTGAGALPTANGARPFTADTGADGLASFTKVTVVGGTRGPHGASRRVVATVPLDFTTGQATDARTGNLGLGPAPGDDGLA
jgi:hypothetical protein